MWEEPVTTLKDISNFVAAYPGRKIGIVLTTSKLTPGDLAKALSGSDYTVFFLASANSAKYLATLGPARTVDVSDNFRSEARNKDYSGEEWLGNNHTSWSAAGRRGFSDFTMLPGTYKDGGGPVGAVAVHLTYALGSDLWIQHFISTTDGQTDPQATKFEEVLRDIHRQRVVTPSRYELSPGLASYETQRVSGSYTNLSGNKRQQVSHHIFTVAKHLGL
ncbi:sce7725 family protein [Microbacterium proteolyticum]|uniref:sce7725 family protein n=1 Tax=Microbacterium proteolyticum TaxID=1572644 RepID=UPI0027E346CA|nr:sce7725 family protein [Microbacterium proteolyticum]